MQASFVFLYFVFFFFAILTFYSPFSEPYMIIKLLLLCVTSQPQDRLAKLQIYFPSLCNDLTRSQVVSTAIRSENKTTVVRLNPGLVLSQCEVGVNRSQNEATAADVCRCGHGERVSHIHAETVRFNRHETHCAARCR